LEKVASGVVGALVGGAVAGGVGYWFYHDLEQAERFPIVLLDRTVRRGVKNRLRIRYHVPLFIQQHLAPPRFWAGFGIWLGLYPEGTRFDGCARNRQGQPYTGDRIAEGFLAEYRGFPDGEGVVEIDVPRDAPGTMEAFANFYDSCFASLTGGIIYLGKVTAVGP
jgi:hypothetical protein